MTDYNNIEELQFAASSFTDKAFGENRSPNGALNHLHQEISEVFKSIEALEEFHKTAPTELRGDGRDGDWSLTSEALEKFIELRHEKIIEYADCLLLLLDAISCEKLSVKVIVRAAYEKLEINKTRKWGTPDANGIIEHIKE